VANQRVFSPNQALRQAAPRGRLVRFPTITDGSIVPGNPDLCYGSRPEQVNQKARKDLDGYIVPFTQRDLPVATNFFLEVKGPDGS
jgi:hypothetical protein